MNPTAPRPAIPSWHLRVSYAPSVASDLIEQFGQHRCVHGITSSDLDGYDFQRPFINTDVDFAPDASRGATHCLVGYCAEMPERGSGDAAGPLNRDTDVHCERLLTSADGVEIRHLPVQPVNRSRLSTTPVAWPSSIPNTTFIVRQVWIAAQRTFTIAPLAGRCGTQGHLGNEPSSHTCEHVLPVNGSLVIHGSASHCRQSVNGLVG